MSYFTLRRLSKKYTLWRGRVFTTVRFVTGDLVTTNPSLAPASLPGLLSCLAVVGVGTWEPIPACCQRVLKIPTCAGSSRDLLPPSPPAEKATARQDQAGQATLISSRMVSMCGINWPLWSMLLMIFHSPFFRCFPTSISSTFCVTLFRTLVAAANHLRTSPAARQIERGASMTHRGRPNLAEPRRAWRPRPS